MHCNSITPAGASVKEAAYISSVEAEVNITGNTQQW